tara:strand:- start:42 stop:1211 length:1170 start_codon:yes stop_codon:yes gene_type:complete
MKYLAIILILDLSFNQVINITQGTTYSSINEAVGEVDDYDVIEVGPQTYYEGVIVIWNPLTLTGINSVIDCSGYGTGFIVAANDVNISGFEIIGDQNTVAGIEVTPGCDNVTISNNVIHGMSLPNPANQSDFSYGILAYGAESSPNPPNNLTISNNEIYETSGSGISLGSYTNYATINNNFIHDIIPIEYEAIGEDDYLSVGIMGSYSNQVEVINNTLTNLTVGISFSISNGIIESNSYNSTPILFSSIFYITEENDGFDFITSNNYFMSTSTVSFPLIYMHAYCSSLSMAITLADEGSTILTSDGEEIIEDCNGEWGGDDLPVCESCENIAGDINADNFLDVLDIITIVGYIYGEMEIDESNVCVGDADQNEEINILDITTIVYQITS